MNWPQAIFGSIAAICLTIAFLACVVGVRVTHERSTKDDGAKDEQ